MTAVRRVLIAYFSKPPILEYLERAFRQVGIEVRLVRSEDNSWFDRKVIHRVNKLAHNLRLLPKDRHLFADHPLAHRNFRSQRLLDAYREFKPDLVLIIRGIGFRPDVLAQLRPLFGWWIEQEGRDAEVLAEVGQYDGYFFINGSYLRKARAAGHPRVALLPHAVDPEAFHPLPEVPKSIDVCFVGGWSPRRQQYIEAALMVTKDIVIYGGKWARQCADHPEILRCLKGSYIEGTALNRLYNQSRIVLNITNWGREGDFHSGMTMRVVEVPASGAFLLSDTSLEMADMLESGKHIGTFRDIKEFAQQLAYWLAHDAERARICAEGLQQIRKHHTYDQLVKKILDQYDAMKAIGLDANSSRGNPP